MTSFPAARVTDMHLCPMASPAVPPVPHVGGPILPPCAPTVLIGSLFSARILDMAMCVGPPDAIAQGAATVLVMNMPASRILDSTSHGGKIIMGCFTVLIGGKTATIKVDPNADPAFLAQLRAALAQIFSTPSGREWLRQMSETGREITILQGGPGANFATPANSADASNGTGTNTTVTWDPNTTSLGGYSPAVSNCGSDVILFHEMVHGLHNAQGNGMKGPYETFPGQSGGSFREEERKTVGTSPNVPQPGGGTRPVQQAGPPVSNAPAGQQVDYSRDVPTENSYRRDKGLPDRPSYYPSNWPGGPPW
ncbi:hypothetical protein GXW77_09050 [Roseomonas alkaliterrae]|uniref:Putative Zn-binding protein involved in type VI secretion n=1 Tax=Neoroseomonas alkaliterrae TaxID=1452450 RepID=A0A840Y9V1_9PROT|nr:M91 family zinc metallopeptidase [Neoroseomonas alkaliterrae]MBB5690654.1 putative Zn-binding protein involved in type VI secretion [Neoroseomonas alkaliterrae]MBR0676317.1 hypothetical protein [Neoroseomonas alkaliterrae]